MPQPCCYQGLVGADRADPSGALSLDGAAAIVADALRAWRSLQVGREAAAALPAATALSLRRGPAAAPRAGEVVRCTLAPSSPEGGRLVARIDGARGAAWEAELDAEPAAGQPPAADAPADEAAWPPMRLMRTMGHADCDQAGHVNVQVFMALADEATRVLSLQAGGPADALRIVRSRIAFKRELFQGDVVTVHSGVRRVDADGVDLVHGIVHRPSGALACIVETRVSADAGAGGLSAQAGDWPGLPAARPPAQPRPGASPPDGAVTTAMSVVDAWDADASGQLTLRTLVNLCSIGARQYLATIGLTGARFHREKISVAAVDYLIEVVRRPALGSNVTMRSSLLSAGGKAIRFAHHLVDSDDGSACATVEIVGVMLDLAAHRSMPIPDDVKKRLGVD